MICRWYSKYIFSCGVRYVKSERAGMGKSLYVKRLASWHEKLNNKVTCAKIPIYSRNIDVDLVTSLLRDNTNKDTSMIYHIDIFSEVTISHNNVLSWFSSAAISTCTPRWHYHCILDINTIAFKLCWQMHPLRYITCCTIHAVDQLCFIAKLHSVYPIFKK